MRGARLICAATLVAGAIVVVHPGIAQAAPVVVSTAAEWTAAWTDPAATEISLGADIEAPCDAGSDRARPPGSAPLVVDGDGHSLADSCTTSVGGSWITTATTTWRDSTIISAPEGFANVLQVDEVHLDRVSLRVRNQGAAVLFSSYEPSTVLDTLIELESGGTGIIAGTPGTIDGLRVRGDGSGVRTEGSLAEGDLVIRRSSIVVSGVGLSATGPTVVERSTVQGRVAAVLATGTKGLAISDSTLRIDPAPPVAGTAIAIEGSRRPISFDQVTVLASGANALTVADGAQVGLHATAIADGGCYVWGELVSEGDNAASSATCDFGGPGDRVLADLGLEPYDPDTGSAAPVASSPLVDAVAECGSGLDQLGAARPSGAACDVGAVELQRPEPAPPTTPPPTTPAPARPATPVVGPARFTG